MTLARDKFPDVRPDDEQPIHYERGHTPAEFLRAAGWVQSEYPGPHRVGEARVWTHPDLAIEPVTFALALDIARYPRRR